MTHRTGGDPQGPIRVRVRLFAMQRQQLGRRELELELAPGATAASAWEALASGYPVLASAGPTIRFARNGAYCEPSTGLQDGDELALIPPVAGGAGGPAGSAGPGERGRLRRIELREGPIDDGLVEALRAVVASPADGAVVVFVGQTRETPGTPAPGQEAEGARFAGQRVVGLDYEAFEPMALAVLETIADEIEQRFGVERLAIVHRVGEVRVADVSVAIVVAAPHRDAAFAACRYAIEELKARAPIWKAERFADGSVWLGAPARMGPWDPPGPG